MQLSLDVIDGFRRTARTIANKLYHVPAWCSYGDKERNRFTIHALNADLPGYEVTKDALICYCGSDLARIIFKDIAPKKMLSLEIGDASLFNEHETSQTVKTWRNAGKTPMERFYEDVQETRITESIDISAEIGMKMRAKIAAGYGPIKAEIESELSAKLGIDKKSESETKETRKESLKFVIPRWTETKLIKKTSISDMRQSIAMKALLDASVAFDSNDDWSKSFNSLHSLELYLRGGGGGNSSSADNLDQFMLTREFQDFALNADADLTVSIETDRVARNTIVGSSERVDTHIKNTDGARRRNQRKRRKKER